MQIPGIMFYIARLAKNSHDLKPFVHQTSLPLLQRPTHPPLPRVTDGSTSFSAMVSHIVKLCSP